MADSVYPCLMDQLKHCTFISGPQFGYWYGKIMDIIFIHNSIEQRTTFQLVCLICKFIVFLIFSRRLSNSTRHCLFIEVL